MDNTYLKYINFIKCLNNINYIYQKIQNSKIEDSFKTNNEQNIQEKKENNIDKEEKKKIYRKNIKRKEKK